LDVDIVQACVNRTYTGDEYAVEYGGAFDASVRPQPSNFSTTRYSPGLKTNSRIMSFRNTISTIALTQVQSFFQRFTRPKIEDYVRKATIYYGEVPFLYRVFNVTDVPLKREIGGYKVVRFHCIPRFTRFSHFHR
jgi:hypothetical protein